MPAARAPASYERRGFLRLWGFLAMLDILAALDATPPRGDKRCRLATFLDSISEDTPGRDELIRLVETTHDPDAITPSTRSAQNMARVLTSLGYPTTQNPILDHRSGACRCYR